MGQRFFDGIRGRPWDPLAKNDVERKEIEAEVFQPGDPVVRIERTEDIIPQAREVKLTADIIHRFGYSTDCRKCEAMRAGDTSSAKREHLINH